MVSGETTLSRIELEVKRNSNLTKKDISCQTNLDSEIICQSSAPLKRNFTQAGLYKNLDKKLVGAPNKGQYFGLSNREKMLL